MPEKKAVLTRQYRWWLAASIALAALAGLVYCLFFAPYRPEQALPETAAIAMRWSGDRLADTASVPAPLEHFPALAADHAAFQVLIAAAGGRPAEASGWLLAQNLGRAELALAGVLKLKVATWPAPFPYRQETYRGQAVYCYTLPGGQEVAATYHRGLLLLGRQALQVEAGITQLKGSPASWAARLVPEAALVVQPENLSALGAGLLEGIARRPLSQLQSWCQGIVLQHQAVGTDTLAFSGRLVLKETADRRFSLSAPSRGERLLAYLPRSLAWCYRQPLPAPSHEARLFSQYLRPWLGAEWAQLSLALPGAPEQGQIVLLAAQNPARAEPSLSALAEEIGSLQDYTYQGFHLRQLLVDGLLDPLGITMKNPFVAALGDYVAFSPSQAAIEQLAANLLVGNNLLEDEAFLGLYARQNAGSQAWLYARASLCATLLPAYLRKHPQAFAALLQSYEHWFVAIAPDGSLSGLAANPPAGQEAAAPLLAWQAALDAPASSAVQAFPLDEYGPGFLVQDDAHALYLLGPGGERRWKAQLDGPIRGEIALIDYFGGAQRDLAFATPHSVQVIAGAGPQQAQFRIPLESPAISPLLAADLEGQGQYHFFAACANGYLFGWDRQGRPLPGWNPQAKMDSLVRHPLRHFQYRNRDYILALSEAGTLFAFQRDGSFRFEPVRMGAEFLSPPFVQTDAGFERIALGDSQGFAHIVNFEGEHFRLRLLPDGPGTRFLFLELAGDERKDYLSYRAAELKAHYYEGNRFKPHFAQTLAFVPDTAFVIPRPQRDWIGLLSRKSRKIYLLDEQGRLLPGFPLAGDTPFSLVPLPGGGTLAVTGYGNRVYAYRLLE
jgi:hypothetical protein